MPETPIIQSSFNAGELSPQAYGRVDLAKYFNACKTLKNFICLLHGPAMRRPGFEFIAEVKDSSKAVMLAPFEFSTTQAYILEFGDLYIRIFKDGGQVLPDAWINTEAYVVDDQVLEGGVRYICRLAHTGQQPPNGTYWTAQTGLVAEIASSYRTTNLFYIDFAQSADTLFIAHASHPPSKLVRSDHDSWSLTSLEDAFNATGGNSSWPPFLAQNLDTSVMLTVNVVTGSGTMTASTGVFTADHVGSWWKFSEVVESKYNQWEPATAYVIGQRVTYNGNVYESLTNATSGTRPPVHVGYLVTESDGVVDWRWKHGEAGYVVVTAYVGVAMVDVTVITELPASVVSGTYKWAESAWSDEQGWPQKVTFHDDRLYWSRTGRNPQAIWGSVVGVYSDHSMGFPLDDADALSLVLGARQANAIEWMESAGHLYVGTAGAEWRLTNATGDGPITANSKHAQRKSFNGSANIGRETIGNSVIYAQRHGKVLRELTYSWEKDAFAGDELLILAEHLTKNNTIVQMAFQREPNRVVWCVKSDGKWIGLTYHKEHDVFGWHIHETDGTFEAVAVIPGENEDDLWVVVKRTIDGSDVRYVERLAEVFSGADLSDAKFLDSFLTLDNRQTIGSITHADPGIINLTAHGYSNGDTVLFRSIDDDVDGEEDYTSLNFEEFDVAHKATNTFRLHGPDGADVDLSEYKQVVSATVVEKVTAISGLDHLEGESVDILADGMTLQSQTVSGGAITLSEAGGVIHIGLGYDSDLCTLNPEPGAGGGKTTQGTTKKITSVALRLHDSVGAQIGPDADHLKDVLFVDDTVMMGRPAELFSGDIDTMSFNGSHGKDVNVFVRQSDPLPLTILAIIYELELGD